MSGYGQPIRDRRQYPVNKEGIATRDRPALAESRTKNGDYILKLGNSPLIARAIREFFLIEPIFALKCLLQLVLLRNLRW